MGMTIDDTDLRAAFTAQVENYRRGQTVFLIDGSGSMPAAYGMGGENPVVTAVAYAARVKKQLNPAAAAFFFSDSDEKRAIVPIDLENGEDPLLRFPCGGSFFVPAFNNITGAYAQGAFDKNMHLVIVSDGGISEMNAETRDMLKNFIRNNPTVLLDLIVPGGMDSDFGRMIDTLLPEGDRQKPLVMTAASPEDLPIVMAKVLNTRAGAQGLHDLTAYEAVNGIAQPAKIMSPLKLKKPVVE